MHLSISLSICLSVYLSIYLSTCLSVSIYLSMCRTRKGNLNALDDEMTSKFTPCQIFKAATVDLGFRQLGKMQEFLMEMASVIAETRPLLPVMFRCSSTVHASDHVMLAHPGGWQQPKQTPQPEEFGPCTPGNPAAGVCSVGWHAYSDHGECELLIYGQDSSLLWDL